MITLGQRETENINQTITVSESAPYRYFLGIVQSWSYGHINWMKTLWVISLSCIWIKQWPLAPNSWKWRITRANVSNASHIFPEMTFGECGRVWRVRAKQVGECGRVWRVLAKVLGECRRVWQVFAKSWQMSAHDKVGCFRHKLHIVYV